MAKTDFQIQSESGQLWPDLTDWRDASVAAVAKERDAAIAKCEALVRKLSDPTATKEDVQAEADKEAHAREIEELTKFRDAKAQEVADIEAKIVELSK